MSRSKRADLEAIDPFALSAEAPDTSMKRVADDLYGAIEKSDEHLKKARPVSIFEIQPNPMQPRRAIPHVVRRRWTYDVQRMAEMFDIWLEEIARERGGVPLDVRAYLDGKTLPADFDAAEDRKDEDQLRPLEQTFLSLLELAVSIRNDGLTNPVTVVFIPPERYQLETGERRWLAYHLLYLHTQDERFGQISAREVDQVDVWRQAAENNARAGLNAISRARQLAVLLMDLLHGEEQMIFTPIEAFSDELGFYGQVADGAVARIPRNSADKLLNATGLKSKKQLREYRALLRLPKLVWQIADDLNWPERKIRDMVTAADGNEDLLIAWVVEEAVKVGYSVPMGTVSQKTTTGAGKSRTPGASQSGEVTIGTPRYFAQAARVIARSGEGKNDANQAALNCIQEMRRWLEEKERQIKSYMKR